MLQSRWIWVLCFLSTMVFTSPALATDVNRNRSHLHVVTHGQVVSIATNQVPVEDILRKIADLCDIQITIQGDMEMLASVDYQNVSLEYAFRQLLKQQSLAIVFNASESGGVPEIESLVALSKLGQGSIKTISPSSETYGGRLETINDLQERPDTPVTAPTSNPLSSMSAIDPLVRPNDSTMMDPAQNGFDMPVVLNASTMTDTLGKVKFEAFMHGVDPLH